MLKHNDGLMNQLPAVESARVTEGTEVTGRAGDIAFLLPFLIHGLCATYLLMEKVQLEHMDDNYSSVEEAMPIVLAK